MLSLFLLLAALPQGTDTTVAVRNATRLELNTHEGSITVATWNRREVRIVAEHDRDTRIEIDEGRNTLRVRASGRHGPDEVNWRLTVPADLALELGAHEGDISVTGSRASVSASSVEGSITVRGGSGNVALATVEGDLRIEGTTGKVSLSTVDGNIQVRTLRGDLTLSTVDGDILLDDVESDNLVATSVDGNIAFAGVIKPRGRYRLTSHDGDIIVVAPEVDADVSVSTYSGEFQSDFEITLRGLTERRHLGFTLGKGSARLELESFDGRIELRKGTRLPTGRRD
jgi:hypothetical protein